MGELCEVSINGHSYAARFCYGHWLGQTAYFAMRIGTTAQSFPVRYVTAPLTWSVPMSPEKFEEIVTLLEREGNLTIYITVLQIVRVSTMAAGYRRDDTGEVIPDATAMVQAILTTYPHWLSYESD